MADWDDGAPTAPPGPVDPPAPDQVRPTDQGWTGWAAGELKKCPLPWGRSCRLGIEVTDEGESDLTIDGSRPDNSDNGTYGWVKDTRKVTIRQPPPYRDFTRWRRHYKSVRMQRFRSFGARIIVDCGSGKTWTSLTSYFWKPLEPIRETGPRDAFMWVKSSGLIVKDGAEQEWEEEIKPDYPYWAPMRDFLGANDTPPPFLVNPPQYKLGLDWQDWKLKADLGLKLRYTFETFDPPVPAPGGPRWNLIEELPDAPEPPPR
jgi:hypothetical protein